MEWSATTYLQSMWSAAVRGERGLLTLVRAACCLCMTLSHRLWGDGCDSAGCRAP